MRCFPALLAAAMSIADLASASRVKSRKFAGFSLAGRILTKRATEVADKSAGSADAAPQSRLRRALTEMSAWPSVYPGFKAKFPTASQAVDDFRTANAALNTAKDSTLPSSPTMLDRIDHYEGLFVAAEGLHKAAEGAEHACQAILPDLQQAVETAQKTKNIKLADANQAEAEAQNGMLARLTPLKAWSQTATVAKSARAEAEAAAKAADEAKEAVRRTKNWVYYLNEVAYQSHAGAKRAEHDLMAFEATWDYSQRGNALASVLSQRVFG